MRHWCLTLTQPEDEPPRTGPYAVLTRADEWSKVPQQLIGTARQGRFRSPRALTGPSKPVSANRG
jgi:hypothetical protein